MSANDDELGIVAGTIRDLLPAVNEGFNWNIIEERYDEDPVGTAMSLHFTDETGEDAVEEIVLGIAEGPRIVFLPGVTDEWDYIGAIVTYQDYGIRMLDPDDAMTPKRARYQHGGITIRPAGAESRERVWLVVSNVLDIMLETVIYQQSKQAAQDHVADSGGGGGRDSSEVRHEG